MTTVTLGKGTRENAMPLPSETLEPQTATQAKIQKAHARVITIQHMKFKHMHPSFHKAHARVITVRHKQIKHMHPSSLTEHARDSHSSNMHHNSAMHLNDIQARVPINSSGRLEHKILEGLNISFFQGHPQVRHQLHSLLPRASSTRLRNTGK
jgi:hypothetical protein